MKEEQGVLDGACPWRQPRYERERERERKRAREERARERERERERESFIRKVTP